MKNELLVVQLNDEAEAPKREYASAGYDLFTDKDVAIMSRKSAIVSTGIAVQIPEGYVGIIKAKSGLSVKHNIEVGAGVIDSDYRGEIKVHLYNLGDSTILFKQGHKIAQLLLVPIHTPEISIVESLNSSDRGTKGFGSSGDK